jgi:UDP-N-acetylmuramate--alanine ligase
VAVFQPHLYSRTRLFAVEFGRALAAADLVVVTDVYAAREDPEPGVDGALVAGAAHHARPDLDCVYEPDRAALAARVASLVEPGDLVLTLGAGDITTLADELAPLLGEPGRGAVDSPEPSPRRSATLPPGGAQHPTDGGNPPGGAQHPVDGRDPPGGARHPADGGTP